MAALVARMPAKFQSDKKILFHNLAAFEIPQDLGPLLLTGITFKISLDK